MTHLIEQYFRDEAICPHREFMVLTMRGKFNAKDDCSEYQRPYLLPADICLRGVGTAFTKITAFKKGIVRLDDQWWVALSNSDMSIAPGQNVRVLGIQGHTLLVEPVS